MTPTDFDRWLLNPQRPPLVMGVLNVTPDSFSDGGKFAAVDAAVAHGHEMIDAGASLIDIGGESTRPGSVPVPAEEQIRRVVPVIRAAPESAGHPFDRHDPIDSRRRRAGRRRGGRQRYLRRSR